MFWEIGPKYNFFHMCSPIFGFFFICIQAEKRYRWCSGLFRYKLLKIPNLASRIICIPTPKLSDRVTSAMIWKAHIILNDPDHPLHRYLILLPSGRRYRLPMCRRTRFSKRSAIILHSSCCFFERGGEVVCGCIVISVVLWKWISFEDK